MPVAAETIGKETPYTLTESLNNFSIRNCRLQETEKLKEDAKKGYQLKAGHFLPFWLYGNSKIKQDLWSC